MAYFRAIYAIGHDNMPVNKSANRAGPTLATRAPSATRIAMEKIRRAKGHDTISVTLREAMDEYIARNLRHVTEGLE